MPDYWLITYTFPGSPMGFEQNAINVHPIEFVMASAVNYQEPVIVNALPITREQYDAWIAR